MTEEKKEAQEQPQQGKLGVVAPLDDSAIRKSSLGGDNTTKDKKMGSDRKY